MLYAFLTSIMTWQLVSTRAKYPSCGCSADGPSDHGSYLAGAAGDQAGPPHVARLPLHSGRRAMEVRGVRVFTAEFVVEAGRPAVAFAPCGCSLCHPPCARRRRSGQGDARKMWRTQTDGRVDTCSVKAARFLAMPLEAARECMSGWGMASWRWAGWKWKPYKHFGGAQVFLAPEVRI